ncbi:MAG: hypothetical protein UY78_C0025G0006 [Parcubacteria group bacterium GW2011_GWA1_53_13]|nr:MAG: hypothetical protein UY78_C0025G0006 [Parcubacteria group bacterium GW2011_GWA1_53_13]
MQKVALIELPEFVKRILQSLDHARDKATIVALRGDLGAGKTTFTQALARELGITGTVQSPTYVLMKKYEIKKVSPFKTLVHIDAYRLEKPEEFAALNPEQFLNDPPCLVVVEWPERLGTALPQPALTLNFSSEGAAEGERFIETQK